VGYLLPKRVLAGQGKPAIRVSPAVTDAAALEVAGVYGRLATRAEGLTIQNLGAMDILCTDKTGTLTLDRVILERHCDVTLRESEAVLALAYTNSHFQTGLKNVLDRAVLAHEETHAHALIPQFAKVDEIPFDFQRRVMSVVVRTPEGRDLIISKGAP